LVAVRAGWLGRCGPGAMPCPAGLSGGGCGVVSGRPAVDPPRGGPAPGLAARRRPDRPAQAAGVGAGGLRGPPVPDVTAGGDVHPGLRNEAGPSPRDGPAGGTNRKGSRNGKCTQEHGRRTGQPGRTLRPDGTGRAAFVLLVVGVRHHPGPALHRPGRRAGAALPAGAGRAADQGPAPGLAPDLLHRRPGGGREARWTLTYRLTPKPWTSLSPGTPEASCTSTSPRPSPTTARTASRFLTAAPARPTSPSTSCTCSCRPGGL